MSALKSILVFAFGFVPYLKDKAEPVADAVVQLLLALGFSWAALAVHNAGPVLSVPACGVGIDTSAFNLNSLFSILLGGGSVGKILALLWKLLTSSVAASVAAKQGKA